MFHSTAGSSNHAARSVKKPHSRSNSISSQAATTVKRTSSLNSASTPTSSRPTTAPYGASASTIDGTAGSTTRSSASRRRSSVAHVAQDNSVPVREGLSNLNRWSQSTTSSLSSSSHRRLSTFSKRLSGTANGQAHSNAQNTANSLPSSPRRVLQKRNRSPPSPRKRHPSSPAPAVPSLPLNPLPPIVTLPSLTQAVADAHTPSTAASRTPSTTALFSPTPQPLHADFGDGQGSLSLESESRPPLQQRIKTASEKEQISSPRRTTNSTGPIPSTTIPDTTNRARTPTGKPKLSGDESRTPRQRDRSLSDTARFDERSTRNLDRDTQSRASDRRDKRADKDKKAMLAKALQKANTAVVLDNAQNFEGAIAAYGDACKLLQSVMERSSGEEDRKKLEAIRQTYLNRIAELHALEPNYQEANGKTLPRRPMSDESLSSQSRKTLSIGSTMDEPAVIGTATVTRIANNPSAGVESQSRTPRPPQLPRIRESVISTAIMDVESTLPNVVPKSISLDSSWGTSRSPLKTQVLEVKESMLHPADRTLLPQPLSPRSPLLPQPASAPVELPASPVEMDMNLPRQSTEERAEGENQAESMSWLDTIDESDSSCASSVHSVDPTSGLKRRHLRNTSGQSQAEFDAAFDAAVEAAYDDGFEPYEDEVQKPTGTQFVSQAMRNVELARERVREAKREEDIQAARERERKRLLEENNIPHVRESVAIPYGTQEEDDEERMLEEMTREYMLDDGFDFGLQPKSTLPRESDSSAYTQTTSDSVGGSWRTTAGTSLSTVAEDQESRRMSQQAIGKPPPVPPPAVDVSRATVASNSSPGTSGAAPSQPASSSSSVLTRRFSGQASKQLKIETKPASNGPQSARLLSSKIPEGLVLTPRSDSLQAPKTAAAILSSEKSDDSGLKISRPEIENTITPSSQDVPLSLLLPIASQTQSNDSSAISRSDSPSSSFRPSLKKNQSSLSLSSRGQTLSISSPPSATAPSSTDTTIPVGVGASPNLNTGNANDAFTTQSTTLRRPNTASDRNGPSTAISFAPTPGLASNFAAGLATPGATSTFQSSTTDGGLSTGTGGVMQSLLLTADLQHPDSPTSPNLNPLAASGSAPLPLEPCPLPPLLRPFWLMRAIYQTIAHPRGGYLSTKLFVPRDVWGVRGVKVKGIEEKVSACDLLTAALEKVRVGWEEGRWDVERVAEELSVFENVMDNVQSALSKKLGQEVGVQGVGGLFKDADVDSGNAGGDGDGGGVNSGAGRKLSSSGKNYLSSWRKLRSKNSGAGLGGNYGGNTMSGFGTAIAGGSAALKDKEGKDGAGITIPTLPMTSLSNPRFAKRDVLALDFSGFGGMANYMGSLARLCDAVQVLDQIARQVEDPGLKHSSPAHVGLELGVRHAAEFFGFYICRFVLADVGLLLDKFIKRGSEWVLV